jgi:hypothetical protein
MHCVVYQLLAHGRWFSLGTLAFSTTKTDRHDLAEILLKVALNTKNRQCELLPSLGVRRLSSVNFSCFNLLR